MHVLAAGTALLFVLLRRQTLVHRAPLIIYTAYYYKTVYIMGSIVKLKLTCLTHSQIQKNRTRCGFYFKLLTHQHVREALCQV